MHVERARTLVEQIRQAVTVAYDAIAEAYRDQAWRALGYPDWDAMCDAEFGVRLRIPREEQVELVANLRQQGMSTRAIAPVLGVSKRAAAYVVAGVQNCTPDAVTGLDGKRYPPPARHPTPVADEMKARTRLAERVGHPLWHNVTSNLIRAMREAADDPGLPGWLDSEIGLGNQRDLDVARLTELRDAADTLRAHLTRQTHLRSVQ